MFRQEDSWPPPIGDPAEEENGVVLALDVEYGRLPTIYGMGRHNHENNVAIPGFDDLVVLSGDDTFTSGPLTIPPGGPRHRASAPAQSQLYSYIAPDTDTCSPTRATSGRSSRTTRTSTTTTTSPPVRPQTVTGHFIKVPKNIATGQERRRLGDQGRPTSATRCRPRTAAGSGTFAPTSAPQIGIDGPQWVLEYWSQLNNVFDFVRVEDIAYDKRPGMENVVYVVDSGRGTAGALAGGTPFRSPTVGSGRWCSTRTTRRR